MLIIPLACLTVSVCVTSEGLTFVIANSLPPLVMDIMVDSSLVIPSGDGLSSDTISRYTVSALVCSGLPHTALICAALHSIMLHHAALHCTALHHAAWICTALRHTAWICTALHHAAWICTALHHAASHCAALHCIILHGYAPHCIILDCVSLHHSTMVRVMRWLGVCGELWCDTCEVDTSCGPCTLVAVFMLGTSNLP